MTVHLLIALGGFLAGASTVAVMFRYFAIRAVLDAFDGRDR